MPSGIIVGLREGAPTSRALAEHVPQPVVMPGKFALPRRQRSSSYRMIPSFLTVTRSGVMNRTK